ncbi:MAG: PqqD family protein [Bacteroidales bacterium]|nr:PqqD family protein [Bacteroidales bacterium]
MKINQNIAVSESGYIFNPSTGESFSVNPLGQKIIQSLQKGNTIGQLEREVCAEFEVDTDTFEKDFHEFLNSLKFLNLLDEMTD